MLAYSLSATFSCPKPFTALSRRFISTGEANSIKTTLYIDRLSHSPPSYVSLNGEEHTGIADRLDSKPWVRTNSRISEDATKRQDAKRNTLN